jgi:hypothetical protein
MAHYWIAFVAALAVTALFVGSIVRVIAPRRNWSRMRTLLHAHFSCWLIYLLGLLVQHHLPLPFLPHSIADLGRSFGSEVIAMFLMGVFSRLAGQIGLLGSLALRGDGWRRFR